MHKPKIICYSNCEKDLNALLAELLKVAENYKRFDVGDLKRCEMTITRKKEIPLHLITENIYLIEFKRDILPTYINVYHSYRYMVYEPSIIDEYYQLHEKFLIEDEVYNEIIINRMGVLNEDKEKLLSIKDSIFFKTFLKNIKEEGYERKGILHDNSKFINLIIDKIDSLKDISYEAAKKLYDFKVRRRG